MLVRFSQISSQEKAKEMLRRAITGGKLAHAYLFRGPAGVGKQTTAHALAATLNCRNPPTAAAAALEICGHCPSCRKFASGNHPDLMIIIPEGAAIKIKQVRDIQKALLFPPLEARLRVIVLSEVHTMRREAVNSLLKTLEEPPPGTIFLLTGDETGAIPATILSRCQVIPFFPLKIEVLTALLQAEEGLNREEAATLAAVAEGSLGQARLLRRQDLLELRREVLTLLLDHRPEQPEAVEAILELAERCAELKEDLEDFFDLLSACLHDLALLAAVAPAGEAAAASGTKYRRPLINQDLLPLLTRSQPRWTGPQLMRRLEKISAAKTRLKRNCNRTLVCEVLFFDLL